MEFLRRRRQFIALATGLVCLPKPLLANTIVPARFGMPDATTAGVQSGVTLTDYTGPMTITTPGAVIENNIIDGTLTVAADNVTIKNCIIRNFDNFGILSDNADNTRVEYCDIDGSGSTRTYGLGIGGGTNSAIIGCDISGMVISIGLFGRARSRTTISTTWLTRRATRLPVTSMA